MIVGNMVDQLLKDVPIPRFFKVKQHFERPVLDRNDIPGAIHRMLSEEIFTSQLKPGMSVAITAGSRGVSNIDVITKAVVDFCLSMGTKPFIIPAMGSHGGATAEGQRAILAGYGITEETMGCPVRATMETVKIGETEDGRDVFIDRFASEADGIILINRVKLHTCFRGEYESGLIKMMAIGLAKQHGAEMCHDQGFKYMAKNIVVFGKAILKNAPILFGVATLENAYDETSEVVALNHDEILNQEPALLRKAAVQMPNIMVDSCDLLIVDEIGKNYSGDGMDPNITGTFATPYASGGLQHKECCVLGVSRSSHGNGTGLGMARATTRAVVDGLDLEAMYTNGITAKVLRHNYIPCIMDSDRRAIQICLKICEELDPEKPYIVRIPNSLHIGEIQLSEAYWEEAHRIPGMEVISEPEELPFDENGNLTDRFQS